MNRGMGASDCAAVRTYANDMSVTSHQPMSVLQIILLSETWYHQDLQNRPLGKMMNPKLFSDPTRE